MRAYHRLNAGQFAAADLRALDKVRPAEAGHYVRSSGPV